MKYLVFDLDDTIIPSSQGYQLALESIGVQPNSPDYLEARRRVKSRLGEGHVSARNRWLYFKSYLEIQGRFSPRNLSEIMNRYEKVLSDHVSTEWRNLRREALFRELQTKAHISILTNENSRTQMLKLNSMDPDSTYFKDILTSEEFGVEKPDIRIFKEVHQRIGIPDRSQITFVGDSLCHDLIPANSLGWNTILTSEFIDQNEDEPIPFYQKINDLNKILHIL